MTNAITNYTNGHDYFAEYARSTQNRYIIGSLLKFSKGEFLAGESSIVIPMGTRFVCHMDSLLIGWVKWFDARPVSQIMGAVAAGFKAPSREELGDLDPSRWELDQDGKPRDPWQRNNYLVMKIEDGAVSEAPVDDPLLKGLYTFAASSQGGIDAVGKVCGSYHADIRRQHPNDYPVIELDTSSYLHRNRSYGRIKKPVFKVIGWAPKSVFPDLPQLGDVEEHDAGSTAALPFEPSTPEVLPPPRKASNGKPEPVQEPEPAPAPKPAPRPEPPRQPAAAPKTAMAAAMATAQRAKPRF